MAKAKSTKAEATADTKPPVEDAKPKAEATVTPPKAEEAKAPKVPPGAKLDEKTGRVEAYAPGTFDPAKRKPQKA